MLCVQLVMPKEGGEGHNSTAVVLQFGKVEADLFCLDLDFFVSVLEALVQ